MPGVDCSGKWCKKRIISPRICAPGSFRTKTVKARNGTIRHLVICCPKGKWKGGHCKASTKLQSYRWLKGKR